MRSCIFKGILMNIKKPKCVATRPFWLLNLSSSPSTPSLSRNPCLINGSRRHAADGWPPGGRSALCSICFLLSNKFTVFSFATDTPWAMPFPLPQIFSPVHVLHMHQVPDLEQNGSKNKVTSNESRSYPVSRDQPWKTGEKLPSAANG